MRQSYSVSCNQIGSRTSNAPATLKCIAPYAKLEVAVPSIYAQLNQTDTERLTLRSSLNANPDKGSLVTQSYLEEQETSQQSVYENTKWQYLRYSSCKYFNFRKICLLRHRDLQFKGELWK